MVSVEEKELGSTQNEFEIWLLHDAFVSFCCITKHPKTEWLKTTTIYQVVFMWVSWGVLLVCAGLADLGWACSWAGGLAAGWIIIYYGLTPTSGS